jgi:peptide chain release factor 1
MSDANTAVLRKLSELDARCVEIDRQICDPEIAQDANKLIPLTKEQGKLMPLVSRYRQYMKTTAELEDAQAMLDDPEMKEMAAEEIESLAQQQESLIEEIKNTLVMADDAAIDSVIMEIRPGTGGPRCLPAIFMRCTNATPTSRAGKSRRWIFPAPKWAAFARLP